MGLYDAVLQIYEHSGSLFDSPFVSTHKLSAHAAPVRITMTITYGCEYNRNQ